MRAQDKQAEKQRLKQAAHEGVPWKKWGPYLSERQWGTRARELHRGRRRLELLHATIRPGRARTAGARTASPASATTSSCSASRSRCGTARIPILKERMFGLTNSEGNHGEDVKEYYFYLDSTPTHSYVQMLYKYPQAAFPYEDLVAENRAPVTHRFRVRADRHRRVRRGPLLRRLRRVRQGGAGGHAIRITATTAAPKRRRCTCCPSSGSATPGRGRGRAAPAARGPDHRPRCAVVARQAPRAGRALPLLRAARASCCSPTTRPTATASGASPTRRTTRRTASTITSSPAAQDAVNPARSGTKAAVHYALTVAPGAERVAAAAPAARPPRDLRRSVRRLRCRRSPTRQARGRRVLRRAHRRASLERGRRQRRPPGLRRAAVDQAGLRLRRRAVAERARHRARLGPSTDAQPALVPHVQRRRHLDARQVGVPVVRRLGPGVPRRRRWRSSIPTSRRSAGADAARPLPAPERPAARLRVELRRRQPTRARLGGAVQLPAQPRQPRRRRARRSSSARSTSCCSNFTWWLNRKDRDGRNLFEGGFLGLDNIGVFDRSSPLPTGGYLEQADGTAWMAFYAQNMLDIALELALDRPDLRGAGDQVLRARHLRSPRPSTASARDDSHVGRGGRLLLRRAARARTVHARGSRCDRWSGLLPLCAVSVYRPRCCQQLPQLHGAGEVVQREPARPAGEPARPGHAGRRRAASCCRCSTDDKLRRVLARMLDPNEFLGDHGIRSLSRYHLDHPYVFNVGRAGVSRSAICRPNRTPGCSAATRTGAGRSGRRSTRCSIRALLQMYAFYGDEFRVECPTGSGQYMTLYEVARSCRTAWRAIFLRNHEGRRPVYGGTQKFQSTIRTGSDHVLFYEYFHGDNGAGLGASHQTGWTAVIPAMMQLFAQLSPEQMPSPPSATLAEIAARASGTVDAPGAEPVRHARIPRSTRSTRASSCRSAGVALGRPATLDDIDDAHSRRRRRTGFDWVWFLGRLADRPGRARSLARRTRSWCEECRARCCPICATRTSPDRRSRSPATACTTTSAATRRSRGCATRLARRRLQAAARLRAQPHRARSPVGDRRTRSTTSTAPRRIWRGAPQNYARVEPRAGRRVILAFGRDPYFDGLARHVPAQLPPRRLSRGADRRAGLRSPTAATASAATWRCCCNRRSSSAPGATGRSRPTARRPRTSVLARGDRRDQAAAPGVHCSSPRCTGTWSGSCSRRASTSPTTSASTIGWSRGTARRCAST